MCSNLAADSVSILWKQITLKWPKITRRSHLGRSTWASDTCLWLSLFFGLLFQSLVARSWDQPPRESLQKRIITDRDVLHSPLTSLLQSVCHSRPLHSGCLLNSKSETWVLFKTRFCKMGSSLNERLSCWFLVHSKLQCAPILITLWTDSDPCKPVLELLLRPAFLV